MENRRIKAAAILWLERRLMFDFKIRCLNKKKKKSIKAMSSSFLSK